MRFPKRNYSRGIGDASHFPKFKVSSCQNHPTRPETGNNWTIYQNRTLPKNEFFGGKWREYGRNKRKYDRLGKSLQERNTILWDFPSGEIILGVLEIPCTPQKSKWAAARTIQLAHKLEKWKTYQNRTLPKKEFFGGKWREYGRRERKYDRLWKSVQERARLNTILWDFPRGEIILGVLEIPCTPQKPKRAAARTIQLAHKLEKNEKPIKTERFPKMS